MLSADILAAARAELDAWSARRQEGNNRPESPRRQSAKRAPRSCPCGCGGVEWNRTGVCEAEYFRRRRKRKRGARRVFQLPGKVCRYCAAGRSVKSHRRCNPCYQRYRHANPKLCDCGNYFGADGRRGTKCGRCVKRTTLEKYGRCLCGNRAAYANGECRRCWRDRIKPLCRCGRARVVTADECERCYRERRAETPHVRALNRRRAFRSTRARRENRVQQRKPRRLCQCGLGLVVCRDRCNTCYHKWRYWTRGKVPSRRRSDPPAGIAIEARTRAVE
jgi:hypothetical protein